MTTAERLDHLEANVRATNERQTKLEATVRAIAIRMGLELPETPEEMKAAGVIGVIHGGVVRQRTIGEDPVIRNVIAAQANSALPDLSPAEALARYGRGEPGVAMLLPNPIRHLDADDSRWTSYTTGWHRVCAKHAVTLQNHPGVMRVPEDMVEEIAR